MLWDQEYLLREIKLIKIGIIKDIRNKHGWYELRKNINYNPKNEYLDIILEWNKAKKKERRNK